MTLIFNVIGFSPSKRCGWRQAFLWCYTAWERGNLKHWSLANISRLDYEDLKLTNSPYKQRNWIGSSEKYIIDVVLLGVRSEASRKTFTFKFLMLPSPIKAETKIVISCNLAERLSNWDTINIERCWWRMLLSFNENHVSGFLSLTNQRNIEYLWRYPWCWRYYVFNSSAEAQQREFAYLPGKLL